MAALYRYRQKCTVMWLNLANASEMATYVGHFRCHANQSVRLPAFLLLLHRNHSPENALLCVRAWDRQTDGRIAALLNATYSREGHNKCYSYFWSVVGLFIGLQVSNS